MSRSASVVRSQHVSDLADLAQRSPSPQVHAWLRHGRGLIAWGEIARAGFTGADAMRTGAEWFAEQVARVRVEDDVRRPGSGPIAFVSGAFDPQQDESVFVIPSAVIGRDEFGTWMTYLGDAPSIPTPVTVAGPGAIGYHDTEEDRARWRSQVDDVVARIGRGDVDKAVIARAVDVHAEREIDPRWLLQRLTAAYDSCWTYSVGGLIGATPELLLRLTDGHVYSRVLAGTEWGEGAVQRLRSAKNLEEHAYAAASAAASLEKVTIRLDMPGEPKILTLPNVSHLATEIRGDVAEGTTACDVAAAMHPTAAVGGTPTDIACRVIAEVEGASRGRYAGPVGWVDTHGNGELGIALRGGQLTDARTMRLYAGCGIVAGSDADTELAETDNKLLVMREALRAH
ncbi:isochorismate synthase MenF [Blastococcus sp. Marseille-P5729]|uniref:isochorismate synthase n=1 Tax=Blastococcus sp. Marseille-P5729 TaxID=2086582 RepID=UPI000D1119DB|nr:isochorismate synthase [Blastococcus sp. Marseille-P5729]